MKKQVSECLIKKDRTLLKQYIIDGVITGEEYSEYLKGILLKNDIQELIENGVFDKNILDLYNAIVYNRDVTVDFIHSRIEELGYKEVNALIGYSSLTDREVYNFAVEVVKSHKVKFPLNIYAIKEKRSMALLESLLNVGYPIEAKYEDIIYKQVTRDILEKLYKGDR